MKHKNEGKSWKAIFVGAVMQILATLMIYIAVLLVVTLMASMIENIITAIDSQTAQSPMDYYMEAYEACMATGRFVQDVCHEIGIGAMEF